MVDGLRRVHVVFAMWSEFEGLESKMLYLVMWVVGCVVVVVLWVGCGSLGYLENVAGL